MRKAVLSLIVIAALAGCGRQESEGGGDAADTALTEDLTGNTVAGAPDEATQPEDQTTPVAGPAAENAAAPADDAGSDEPVAGDAAAGGATPASTGARDYVGRWAASRAACGSAAWTVSANRLSTPAGSSCRWSEASGSGGSITARATCSAEGPAEPSTLRLQVSGENNSRLAVSGGPFDAVTLVRCSSSEGPGTD